MLLEKFEKQMGLSRADLVKFAQKASHQYKSYNIPKRSGGTRRIDHPTPALKAVQRWLNRYLFLQMPVHFAATAYVKGANIRDNALVHRSFPFTLRADFEDFFPSFHVGHVKEFLKRTTIPKSPLTEDDIDFVVGVVSRHGSLTIGAPSSPLLTNVMMFAFDSDMSDWAGANGCVYTRYADDMFVSSRNPDYLQEALRQIARYSAKFELADLRINKKKTAFLSRKHRRTIAGLTITPDYRVSIGLERKKDIKHELYEFCCGRLEPERYDHLRGWIAFVKDCEPEFFSILARKYKLELLSTRITSVSHRTA